MDLLLSTMPHVLRCLDVTEEDAPGFRRNPLVHQLCRIRTTMLEVTISRDPPIDTRGVTAAAIVEAKEKPDEHVGTIVPTSEKSEKVLPWG